jgi:molybdate transport system regulatory protein
MQAAYNRRMEKSAYTLDAELMLCVGDKLLANAKRIELLRQIGLTENLTKSAKIAGYSYKGAWDTIEQMTQLTGDKLLERHAGGKGGGKTCLTERGHQLLKNFTLIQSEHARFIARLNKLANGLEADYAVETEIAMKTSARNQFAGIIVSILQGPVNDEITLMVNGSLMLVASITHGSCRELQLDIGAKVFALIKASSIKLVLRSAVSAAASPDPALAKNAFAGVAHTVVRGEHTSEVAVLLDGGMELVGTLPNATVDVMALKRGDAVMAGFDPSSVIIGIAA